MPRLDMQSLFESGVPEIAASRVLEAYSGRQREAEVALWEAAKRFDAGGPSTPQSPEHRFVVQIILAMVDGKELPAVPRAARMAPHLDAAGAVVEA